jgi:WD40 repeat protein
MLSWRHSSRTHPRICARLHSMADHGEAGILFRVAIANRRSRFANVAWSPDGRLIAAAGGSIELENPAQDDGVVFVWQVNSGQPLLLEGHTALVTRIAWSPDGRLLARRAMPGLFREDRAPLKASLNRPIKSIDSAGIALREGPKFQNVTESRNTEGSSLSGKIPALALASPLTPLILVEEGRRHS